MKHSEDNDTLPGFYEAAQLSGGDLHQFHGFAVAIGRHPRGFETTLVSDMHL